MIPGITGCVVRAMVRGSGLSEMLDIIIRQIERFSMNKGLLWAQLHRQIEDVVDNFAGVAGVSVLDLISGQRNMSRHSWSWRD